MKALDLLLFISRDSIQFRMTYTYIIKLLSNIQVCCTSYKLIYTYISILYQYYNISINMCVHIYIYVNICIHLHTYINIYNICFILIYASVAEIGFIIWSCNTRRSKMAVELRPPSTYSGFQNNWRQRHLGLSYQSPSCDT